VPESDVTWVTVAESSEVVAGSVVPMDDHDVVVWRTSDGAPCVMDARCPHEWSHLAVEGVVEGDHLVCCSHFWRFGRTGDASTVDRQGRRTERLPITVFRCRELEDRIEALIPVDRMAS
jgi:phenylpropionate dioxygenase-like ring-hydroxylating dioxygenase large terminal subunit